MSNIVEVINTADPSVTEIVTLAEPVVIEIINTTALLAVEIVNRADPVVIEVTSTPNPAIVEVVAGQQSSISNAYTFARVSPESEPYKYGLFNDGSKWKIKRWDFVNQVIGYCLGNSNMDSAWTGRGDLEYSDG